MLRRLTLNPAFKRTRRYAASRYRAAATIRARPEDYRAAATRDFEDDERDLGVRVRCPVLALWGEFGKMHTL
jgi:haloacetate dehalogenase